MTEKQRGKCVEKAESLAPQ